MGERCSFDQHVSEQVYDLRTFDRRLEILQKNKNKRRKIEVNRRKEPTTLSLYSSSRYEND